MATSKQVGTKALWPSLVRWHQTISSATFTEYPDSSLRDSLAGSYAQELQRLLEDKNVRVALEKISQKSLANGVPQVALVDAIKNMLVDACWMARLSVRQVPHPATRAEKADDLEQVASECRQLAKRLSGLISTVGHGLQLQYLEERLSEGNASSDALKRKSFARAMVPPRGPFLQDALESLADHMMEKAEILMRKVKKKRQTRGSQAEHYMLIDRLCTQSLIFGAKDIRGQSLPAFEAVYAILKSVRPQTTLDLSTLRYRWRTSAAQRSWKTRP